MNYLSFLYTPTHTAFSFTSTVTGATLLITATGFSWAIIMWAPLALVRLYFGVERAQNLTRSA